MTFDPKEGIVGGAAWLRSCFEDAKRHERAEDDAQRLARRRYHAAQEATNAARQRLIDAIPTGAGQAAAEYVPWRNLGYDDARDGWYMVPGGLISEGAGELGHLARILGVRVEVMANGVRMEADPGDSAEVVMDRWQRALEVRRG